MRGGEAEEGEDGAELPVPPVEELWGGGDEGKCARAREGAQKLCLGCAGRTRTYL